MEEPNYVFVNDKTFILYERETWCYIDIADIISIRLAQSSKCIAKALPSTNENMSDKYQTNIKPIYPRGGNERSKKWPLVLQVLPQWEFDTVKTTM